MLDREAESKTYGEKVEMAFVCKIERCVHSC